jgi:hypothetical protein
MTNRLLSPMLRIYFSLLHFGTVETSLTTKLDDNTSTTVKGSFDKKEKDLFMGDVIVNYKSKTKGEGNKFNTGSFSCWINQK